MRSGVFNPHDLANSTSHRRSWQKNTNFGLAAFVDHGEEPHIPDAGKQRSKLLISKDLRIIDPEREPGLPFAWLLVWTGHPAGGEATQATVLVPLGRALVQEIGPGSADLVGAGSCRFLRVDLVASKAH